MVHSALRDMIEVTSDGKLRYNFHRGQWRAWESMKRQVVVLAGTQSGKTVFGSPWLYREIQQTGFGDSLVVSPTFQLLEKKALPELIRHFSTRLRLGEYRGSPTRHFTFSEDGMRRTFGDAYGDWERRNVPPVEVLFGYATKPSTLESMTIRGGIWCDEAGQDEFKPGSYEALRRRGSIYQPRMLYTTTVYNLGWLKQELYDAWESGDPDIDVIQFDSTENPAFPMAEYLERESKLPMWRFAMMYKGQYTRPAGLIFDCFDSKRHIVKDFEIPRHWRRFVGVDFGSVNTCLLLVAEDPENKCLYVYAEYHAGGRTEKEHINHALKDEPKDIGKPIAWGGSHQEDGWRSAFTLSGLTINEPQPTGSDSVQVQIDRTYAAIKTNQVYVFRSCIGTTHELATMSRELDEEGEPTEKIKDEAKHHHMAALRYVISQLRKETASSQEIQAMLNQLPVMEVN